MVGPIGKTVLGGLSFGTLMTLFLMPTVYYIMNRRSDIRAQKAEARRQRIALGLSRKDFEEQMAAKEPEPKVFGEIYSDQSHSGEAHP
jgi:HAE1 family hydrophobic/amphiphilic exporter-1